MEKAKLLGQKRDKIEYEISMIKSRLGTIGEHGSLVDAEGFPLAHVDVHGVRSLRSELAKLQTDLSATECELEHALHAVHAEARAGEAGAAQDEVETIDTPGAQERFEKVPFARIDEVTLKSPAAEAGLEKGDLLLLFGSIDNSNFTGMESVAAVVQSSVGKRVRVMLKRGEKMKLLPLYPKRWSGQGMLGCRIVPLS